MKKACIIVGILLFCLLVGCTENITIQIQISDKIVVNKQEKIILTENGKEIDDKLQWTISNYDVAEINDGILYAKTVGIVIISTVYNQNIYTKELEIIDPYVEDIIIDGKTEVIIGKTIKLNASVVPNIIKSEVVWESEDENIASVNNGVVKGISIGAVNIIVKCDNFQKKYLVNVIDYPSSLEISIEKELGIGEITIPEYNVEDEILLSSDNQNIVKIVDGSIIGLSVGTATITATVKDRINIVSTATLEVKEKTKQIDVKKEDLNKAQELITKMNTRQLVGEMFNISFKASSWYWWDSAVEINKTTGLPDAEYGQSLTKTNVLDYVSAYPFGNYTLFTDYTDSRNQIQTAIETLKRMGKDKTGINPFIAIEYSGGVINGLNSFPTNDLIGANKNLSVTYNLSNTLGKEFKAMGINVVMDNYASTNARNYCDDVFEATMQGYSIKRGYKNNGIISAMGSLYSMDANSDIEEINQKKIKYACLNGYEMISLPLFSNEYIGDNQIKVQTNNYLTKVINEYQYNGVIMLDFNSSANISSTNQFIEAINNGYDMINFNLEFQQKVPNNEHYKGYMENIKSQMEIVFRLYDEMVSGIADGSIDLNRIKEAVTKILLVKIRNGILEENDITVDYNDIATELAKINANYVIVEGNMGTIDKTTSTLVIADHKSNLVTDNSLGYILTQHFKSKGYTNSLVYSFNTLSFSKISREVAQYENIYIFINDMNEEKVIQSKKVIDFVEEMRQINPNICIILSGDKSEKEYFPSIHNFIYLNNFYDSKFANLINVLDKEIAK